MGILANALTVSCLLLTFVVMVLFGKNHTLDLLLIATVILIFVLDALDGYVVRKQNETSQLGGILDTLADRIIENTFWLYFTIRGLIPVEMPIAVMARGFITDTLQGMNGYPKSGWTHALIPSRISRALSGITKMLVLQALLAR